LFISERGQPLTRQAVNYLVREAAAAAGLKNVHLHALRHSCGYYLADGARTCEPCKIIWAIGLRAKVRGVVEVGASPGPLASRRKPVPPRFRRISSRIPALYLSRFSLAIERCKVRRSTSRRYQRSA
jgi:Phage integrase family